MCLTLSLICRCFSVPFCCCSIFYTFAKKHEIAILALFFFPVGVPRYSFTVTVLLHTRCNTIQIYNGIVQVVYEVHTFVQSLQNGEVAEIDHHIFPARVFTPLREVRRIYSLPFHVFVSVSVIQNGVCAETS